MLKRLRKRWMADVRISASKDGLRFEKLDDQGWSSVSSSELCLSTPFARIALLIPDHDCVFRSREFPTSIVTGKNLDEAVALDIPQWNPFDEAISWLAFSEVVNETWRVAIWIWPDRVGQQLLSKLPKEVQCTHILPNIAWFVCRQQGGGSHLFIDKNGTNTTYALVS